jgi:hypothetical protein
MNYEANNEIMNKETAHALARALPGMIHTALFDEDKMANPRFFKDYRNDGNKQAKALEIKMMKYMQVVVISMYVIGWSTCGLFYFA